MFRQRLSPPLLCLLLLSLLLLSLWRQSYWGGTFTLFRDVVAAVAVAVAVARHVSVSGLLELKTGMQIALLVFDRRLDFRVQLTVQEMSASNAHGRQRLHRSVGARDVRLAQQPIVKENHSTMPPWCLEQAFAQRPRETGSRAVQRRFQQLAAAQAANGILHVELRQLLVVSH